MKTVPLSSAGPETDISNAKAQFLRAVELLAPGDRVAHEAARRVPERLLPRFAGGAALEFVVAYYRAHGRACPARRVTSVKTPTLRPRSCPAK